MAVKREMGCWRWWGEAVHILSVLGICTATGERCYTVHRENVGPAFLGCMARLVGEDVDTPLLRCSCVSCLLSITDPASESSGVCV